MLALTRPDLTLQLTSKVRVAVSFLVSKTGPALSFLSIDRGIVTVCQVTEDGGQVSVATPRGVWGLWGKSRNVAGSWERAWGAGGRCGPWPSSLPWARCGQGRGLLQASPLLTLHRALKLQEVWMLPPV